MNSRPSLPTVEVTVYAVLLVLALALRLYHLGAHPLTDEEAREALAALARLRGEVSAATLPASPAYFFFAYWSFYLFGASEATARLGPALAGAALVLVPAFFRGSLGRGAALAASALLAVSSTLLAASRSVEGASLALLGLALAAGSLWHYARFGQRRWLLLGAAGLALGVSSGGPFLHGALALALTLAIVSLTQPESAAALRAALRPLRQAWRPLLLVTVVLSLLIVTLGSLYTRGLGALTDSVLAWLVGFWPGATGRPARLLPMFFIAYEPLLLVFGLVGAVLAARRGHRLAQGLAWFSLVAFALAVVYSGRDLADLVWVAAGMAALAGWAMAAIVGRSWEAREWPQVAAQAGIGLALGMFALLNVAAFAEATRGGRISPPVFQTVLLGRSLSIGAESQLVVAGLAVVLILVVAYLFAMGWSQWASRLGLALTGLAMLLPATLSAGWGATQARADQAGELWWPKPASADIWRLRETLGNVSNFTVGNTHDIELTVQASETGTLRWLLRDFPNAVFVDRLGPQMISPVVITSINEENPTLGSSYVGQDFDLRAAAVPLVTLSDWVGWAAYRRTPAVQAEPVILWVRQDVQELTSTGS
jgi:hypothetical protein